MVKGILSELATSPACISMVLNFIRMPWFLGYTPRPFVIPPNLMFKSQSSAGWDRKVSFNKINVTFGVQWYEFWW